MVFFTRVLGYAEKITRKYLRSTFTDTLRLRVRGGSGGSGLPRYGGIGGMGGSVYVAAKEGLTLGKVKKRLKDKKLAAKPGQESSRACILGAKGEDLIINVPVGVMAYNENKVSLGEVNAEGEKILVAKGGLGGCTDTGYCGQKGEARTIILDLKMIADVGLVGFPNAGKSTFLHAVSKAKPKIASYPFTTVTPQLGIIKYEDLRQISVADLPGLIEGAHANRGKGHQFLKHIERTKLLLFIVDIQGFRLSYKHAHRTCLETIFFLNKELECYKPDLLNLPAMIIVNKMDTENALDIYNDLRVKLVNLEEFVSQCPVEYRPEKILQFEDILCASLIQKQVKEIDMIKQRIRSLIDKYDQKSQECNMLEARLYEKLHRHSNRDLLTMV